MLKISYKTSNLFSLKKYNDSNLNCQSYAYPTLYGLRCAILGSVIQVDGIEKAQELFHKIKNAIIYVQYPNQYQSNGMRIKRYTNSSYKKKYKKINLQSTDKKEECFSELGQLNGLTQMGYREYIDLDNIIFYIDKSVPDIEMYLKNIDWIGTAESLVYLESIQEVNSLKNVMVLWNEDIDEVTYEQYDWDKKITFENVYMYSKKRKHLNKKIIAYISDLHI